MVAIVRLEFGGGAPVPLTPPLDPGLESRRAGRQAQRRARAPLVPLEPCSRSGCSPSSPSWGSRAHSTPGAGSGTARGCTISARSSTSGPGGTATGSSGSPRTATPGLRARRRSFRSIRFSSPRSAPVLAGHAVLAGVVVSLAAGAAAFVLLYRLTSDRLGEEAARRTTLFLALAPTSLFFGAVYSESLFLLLAVATFLAAERGRFWQAGALAGLALLTRSAGVALLPALLVLAWRAPDRRRALAGVAVAPALFALYPLLLAVWIGRPLALSRRAKGRLGTPSLAGRPARRRDRGRSSPASCSISGWPAVLIALGVVAWRRIGACVWAVHPHERPRPVDLRLGQDPALVDAALRRRRLPGVHGPRDGGAEPACRSGHGRPSLRVARRVCGQMGTVVLGCLIGARR